MKQVHYYIHLRSQFPEIGEDENIEITVAELARIFDCTVRNVPLILKKMEQNSWIHWTSGRGRGNRSSLTFLVPPQQLVLEHAQERLMKKDIRGALELADAFTLSDEAREQFNRSLFDSFGYRTEIKNRKQIDTLRFPLSGPVHTLDPLRTNFAAESHMIRQLFDTLVRYHARTGVVEPHLAHAWETDPTRTRWTFFLRKGVLFHHGREMTASDVKYSLERPTFFDLPLLYRWAYEQIERIEVLGPTLLEIVLKTPNELFLAFLATPRTSIVPRDACERAGDRFGIAPVGTGPFKLTHRDETTIVLEAFTAYFKERAHFDRVEAWNIPDLYGGEREEQLQQFQLLPNIGKNTDESAWTQIRETVTVCKFVTFNPLRSSLIQSADIREALSSLMDEQCYPSTDDIEPAHGFIEDTHRSIEPLRMIEDASRSSEHVNEYEYGTENGSNERIRSTLTKLRERGHLLRLCTIPHYAHDAERIRQRCAQAGLDIRVELLTPEQFKSDMRLTADMTLFALMLDNEIELRLIDLYKTMQHRLPPDRTSRLNQQLSQVLKETDSAERTRLYQQIECDLKRDHLIRFLYKKRLKTVYHRSLRGIPAESPESLRFSELWFDRRQR